jgi:uncharacterized protein (TIGR03085 family)
MNDARSERADLSALLLDVGPNAPTLCEGWTTRDLVVHLILRESDPVASAGMMVGPLRTVLDRRSYELGVRTAYPELVARFRGGPTGASLFRLPGVDAVANLVEFFIHHEDVRRAGGRPLPPRDLPPEFEDVLWARLRQMSRILFRKARVGLRLERETGDTLPVRSGSRVVHLVGRPSELLLYGSGRASAAHVEVVGETAAVSELNATLGF